MKDKDSRPARRSNENHNIFAAKRNQFSCISSSKIFSDFNLVCVDVFMSLANVRNIQIIFTVYICKTRFFSKIFLMVKIFYLLIELFFLFFCILKACFASYLTRVFNIFCNLQTFCDFQYYIHITQ